MARRRKSANQESTPQPSPDPALPDTAPEPGNSSHPGDFLCPDCHQPTEDRNGLGWYWCTKCRTIFKTKDLPAGVVPLARAGGVNDSDYPYAFTAIFTPHYIKDYKIKSLYNYGTSDCGSEITEAKPELTPGNPPEPKSGLSVSGNDITVDGVVHYLDDAPAAFLKALAEAGPGVWVAGNRMGPLVQPHPERVFKKIPKPIRDKIESKTGAGYRIRPV